ncbi:MAG: hypothetical protein AB1830_10620 [Pseudomonadota bacterium]
MEGVQGHGRRLAAAAQWIKAVANARDVPYQSLIKVWLEEKLSA